MKLGRSVQRCYGSQCAFERNMTRVRKQAATHGCSTWSLSVMCRASRPSTYSAQEKRIRARHSMQQLSKQMRDRQLKVRDRVKKTVSDGVRNLPRVCAVNAPGPVAQRSGAASHCVMFPFQCYRASTATLYIVLLQLVHIDGPSGGG